MDGGADELAATAARVEDALAAAGVERSERPFRAHLTLARADGIRAGSDVARRLIDAAAGRRSTFAATELILFETIAGGGPARYTPLHTAPLNLLTRRRNQTVKRRGGATIRAGRGSTDLRRRPSEGAETRDVTTAQRARLVVALGVLNLVLATLAFAVGITAPAPFPTTSPPFRHRPLPR